MFLGGGQHARRHFWISDAVIRVSSLKLEWSYLPANNSTNDVIHALLHKQHPGGGYEDAFPLAHPFLHKKNQLCLLAVHCPGVESILA